MHKRFSTIMMTCKVFFLCISIFFLVQGVQQNKGYDTDSDLTVTFTVDRYSDAIREQIAAIDMEID